MHIYSEGDIRNKSNFLDLCLTKHLDQNQPKLKKIVENSVTLICRSKHIRFEFQK